MPSLTSYHVVLLPEGSFDTIVGFDTLEEAEAFKKGYLIGCDAYGFGCPHCYTLETDVIEFHEERGHPHTNISVSWDYILDKFKDWMLTQ